MFWTAASLAVSGTRCRVGGCPGLSRRCAVPLRRPSSCLASPPAPEIPSQCRPRPHAAPFSGTSLLALYAAIRDEPLCFPEAAPLSAPLRALLEGLLDKNPDSRLGLAAAAAHEWTTDGGRLPPVPLWGSDAGAAQCEAPAAGGGCGGDGDGGGRGGEGSTSGALTAWVHQVKQAVPTVEERVFRRGQLVVRCGRAGRLVVAAACIKRGGLPCFALSRSSSARMCPARASALQLQSASQSHAPTPPTTGRARSPRASYSSPAASARSSTAAAARPAPPRARLPRRAPPPLPRARCPRRSRRRARRRSTLPTGSATRMTTPTRARGCPPTAALRIRRARKRGVRAPAVLQLRHRAAGGPAGVRRRARLALRWCRWIWTHLSQEGRRHRPRHGRRSSQSRLSSNRGGACLGCSAAAAAQRGKRTCQRRAAAAATTAAGDAWQRLGRRSRFVSCGAGSASRVPPKP